MQYVDFLITSDDVKHNKPDPEPYLKLLELSGFDANDVLALEDSEIGQISANRAKIQTLVVNG